MSPMWSRAGRPITVSPLPLSNNNRRVAAHDGARGHGATHHSAEGHYGTRADMGAGGEYGAGGDPGPRADADRSEQEIKARVAEIVVAGAEVGALRKAHQIPEGDGGEVVEPGVFRQPAGAAKLKAPGEFDAQAGLKAAAAADLGPEGAQQRHAPSGAGQPAGAQQGGTSAEPEGTDQQGRTGVPIGRGAVAIELLGHAWNRR